MPPSPLQRLLIAVPIGLVTTFVGMVFVGVAVHGPEWSEYVPMIVMPTVHIVALLGPFHSDWYILVIFVAQSALWYGLLSIPDLIRTAGRRQ